MGKGHRLAERRQAIVAAIEEAGELSVAELSARFGVSEVTIRGDLKALSAQGLLQRTRGGALAPHVLPELSFDVRQQQRSAEKARIGRAAAALIHHGDTIAIDASTTALAILPHLKHLSELTIVTNSLKAAMNLLRMPHIHVIVPGGTLRRDSISLVGRSQQNDLLEDIYLRIGFFGARGLTVDEGLTDVNLDEVRMKRWLVDACQQVVGVVDARKWGQVATATFASLDQVDTIITDNEAPADLVEQVRRSGVEVVIV